MQVHKRAILELLETKEKGVNKPMLALWATSRSESAVRALKAAVSEVKVGGLLDGHPR